jgi:hypothetical protein
MRKFSIILLLFTILCSAEPTKVDLDRSIKYFLQLRFQSELDMNLKQYSDYELFQISCKNLRLKCDKVLQLLQKENPEFYHKLMESKK